MDHDHGFGFPFFHLQMFELEAAVNVAESSDGLDELERLAASCDTDESRESSAGN